MPETQNLMKGTKRKILETLRHQDELSLQDLADELDVSNSTINEHLSNLQAMNLIDRKRIREGPGRPYFVYYLTEEAEPLFPHAYAQLAGFLLEVVNSLVNEPETKEKIAEVITEHLEDYEDIESALDAFGFYPEFDDQNNKIIYHQCPFYEVAQDNPTLCDVDRLVLKKLTDQNVTMEDNIAEGCNHCSFVLSQN